MNTEQERAEFRALVESLSMDQQERADFEAWHREKYESTLYCESRWDAWQARAALHSQRLTVDTLAQEIRRVDGGHNLGAGALAEALMPFIHKALQSQDREDAYIPKERSNYTPSITDCDAVIAQREGYTEGWNDCRQDVIDHALRVEGES